MTRRVLVPACTLLATTVLLTGCAGQGSGTASASSSASSSSTSSSGSASSAAEESAAATSSAATGPAGDDGGTGAPAFPANTEPDTAEASSDARVTVADIRTGRHDGFDRVVFEVDGTGTPGWDVRYVDAASSQGSGEPVDVAGDAVLQVTVTGAGYPYDTGVEEYAGPDPLPGQGTATVTEVAFDATFEGTTVAFVGTRAQAPFRVYLLEDPSRIVVEVADPD
ncbi:AMIN-like domain-containing (lipo)protein [Geodermatophilus maliterrae]|uniref:AMIN-like domain-containing protein n=1 Tax=Geodermatophilus maliterrae TaxID=3162531 RepID=A0ABV3XJI1_9ACTN